MFKLNPSPEFTHKVAIVVPVDGGHREDMLTVRYRVLASSEAEAFSMQSTEEFKAYLRAIIVALDDLGDAEGKPLPYSDQVREAVLDLPYARIGLARGYSAALTKAKLGN